MKTRSIGVTYNHRKARLFMKNWVYPALTIITSGMVLGIILGIMMNFLERGTPLK
jgi:hypothetical protein